MRMKTEVVTGMCSSSPGSLHSTKRELKRLGKRPMRYHALPCGIPLFSITSTLTPLPLYRVNQGALSPESLLLYFRHTEGESRKPHQVPVWKDIYVQSDVPERMNCLKELACNLWWAWNFEAEQLFKRMDPTLWESCRHNPRMLIEKIDFKRLLVLAEDEEFLADMDRIYGNFRSYMDRPEDTGKPKVAYFSMEFGIHPCLKIYSGGLGILAGDYLKEASDSNIPITGIGSPLQIWLLQTKTRP
jgi:hypothetical protein